MSLVTGSLLGKLERQWIMTGLTPFRYWYPKKLSSHQCSVTYSGGWQEREPVGLETTSQTPVLPHPSLLITASVLPQEQYEVHRSTFSVEYWTLRARMAAWLAHSSGSASTRTKFSLSDPKFQNTWE